MNLFTSIAEKKLLFVLATIAFFLAAFSVAQIFTQMDLYVVNKFSLGIDYRDFYNATENFKNNISPYTDRYFVTPPTFILLNYPLSFLDIDAATKSFFWMNILAVLISIFLLTNVFNSKNKWSIIALTFIIVLLSHPFQFLLDRDNIDAIVLCCFCFGLFFNRQNLKIIAGVCFAIAIGLKVYPILILIPLLINKEYKLLLAILVSLLGICLMMPHLWLEFINLRLLDAFSGNEINRFAGFRMYENGSLANLFVNLNHFLKWNIANKWLFKLSNVIYLILLAALSIGIFKNKKAIPITHQLLMFIPFMICIPKLAYIYEYVALIPLLFLFTHTTAKNKKLELGILIIAAFLFFNTIVLSKLVDNHNFHFIPILALLITSLYFINWVFHPQNFSAEFEK